MSDVMERPAQASRRLTVHFPPKGAAALAAIQRASRLKENIQVIEASIEAYLELLQVDRANGRIVVSDGKTDWPYSPHTEFDGPELMTALDCADDEDPEAQDRVQRNFLFDGSILTKIEAARTLSRFTTNGDLIRASLAAFAELVAICRAGYTIRIDYQGKSVHYSPFAPLNRSGLALASD